MDKHGLVHQIKPSRRIRIESTRMMVALAAKYQMAEEDLNALLDLVDQQEYFDATHEAASEAAIHFIEALRPDLAERVKDDLEKALAAAPTLRS